MGREATFVKRGRPEWLLKSARGVGIRENGRLGSSRNVNLNEFEPNQFYVYGILMDFMGIYGMCVQMTFTLDGPQQPGVQLQSGLRQAPAVQGQVIARNRRIQSKFYDKQLGLGK